MKRSLISLFALLFFVGFSLVSCNAASFLKGDDDEDGQYAEEEEEEETLDDDEEVEADFSSEAKSQCKYFNSDQEIDIHGLKINVKDYIDDASKYVKVNEDTLTFQISTICTTTTSTGVTEANIKECQLTDFKDGVRFDVVYNFTISKITESDDCEDITYSPQIGEQRNNNGCFDPETRIRSIENREVPIRFLSKGDRVYNPLNKKFMEIEKIVIGPEELPMVEVQVAGKVMKVSSTHAFITKKGPKMAMDVNLNDEVALEDGKTLHPVERVSLVLPVDPKQQVINIKLKTNSKNPKEHAVLANGIVSGDLFLQSELEKKAGKVNKRQDKKDEPKDVKKEEVKEVKKEVKK